MAYILNILDDFLPPVYDSGLEVLPHRIYHDSYPSRHWLLPRGARGHQLQRKSKGKMGHIGKDGFQVCLDVGQFKPSELQVKVVDDAVVIEGKHEEREDDHGSFISRHFVRRYALPKEYDSNNVMSTLSSDGVLTVSLPKPAITDKTGERIVQIQQVGPAHLNVKENAEQQIENGDKPKE